MAQAGNDVYVGSFNRIYQSVLIVDSSAPITGQFVSQGFWFTDARIAVTFNVFY